VKKYVRGLAIVGVVALGVAACGSKPADDKPAAGGHKDFNACMVSDSGGFDDKSFNQTSYKGLQDAVSQLGLTEKKAESKSDNDYPTNMNAMVAAKCNVIVPVGFKLADATEAAAKANPNIKFAIVDYNGFKAPIPNVKPLVFNTAQSSFLAGYLAAGMTKSGKVGTFGGAQIPTVTIFMDGFAEGVAYYNKTKSKTVQVVGWDSATQKGLFTGDFESTAKGQRRQGQRDLGRHRRLRQRGGVLQRPADQRLQGHGRGRDGRDQVRCRRQVQQRGVRRHAGQQRHRPVAVPRLGQQDPGRSQDRDRPAEEGPDRRQDQGRVEGPAVTRTSASS
jgi:hypothetical protein